MQVAYENKYKNKKYSVLNLIPRSLAKTGISVAIIAFSSFLNAELTFKGWRPDYISFILGSTAIFELVRFIFARLSDKNNVTKKYYSFGFILALIGIVTIPFFLLPLNNLLMLIPMSLFFMGSAIMSTLIDSHLTAISDDNARTDIATAIQLTRLSGFAIGGILGASLYSTRGSQNEIHFAGGFFTSFTVIIGGIFLFAGLISLLTMNDNDRILNTQSDFNMDLLKEDILSKPSRLMLTFLLIYPIGLFMQDQILEPYAIIRLGFQVDGVGRLVQIWASLTLIFAPIGNMIAKRVSKISSLFSGQFIGTFGLIIIALAGFQYSEMLLYFGVILFGVGSGLFAVSGVTYMLDIVALHKRNLALILSIFGMVTTISRSLAASLAAVILNLTNFNFELVFLIEALFFLGSILPILSLEKNLIQLKNENINISA